MERALGRSMIHQWPREQHICHLLTGHSRTQKRTYICRTIIPVLLHLKPQHKSRNLDTVKAESPEQTISMYTLRCANSPSSTCFSKPHTCTSSALHSDATYATFHPISAFFYLGKWTNTNPGKCPDLFKQRLSYYRGSCATVMVLFTK